MNLKEKIIMDISQEIRERSISLSNGGASSYESYRYQCGIIAGLSKAKSMIIQGLQDVLIIGDEDD